MTDQARPPWSAWGAVLPMYFDETIAVANLACSGRSLRSFRAEQRLRKLFALLQPGDYVFIQFGHNDQKEKGEGIGAFTSYTDDLNDYIDQIRDHGGQVVLVTPVVRRRLDKQGRFFDTLGDYPEAMRRVSAARDVPLIDLHRLSRQLIESLGPSAPRTSISMFPPEATRIRIGRSTMTRTSASTGAELIAQLVVNAIREELPDLAKHIDRRVLDVVAMHRPTRSHRCATCVRGANHHLRRMEFFLAGQRHRFAVAQVPKSRS